MHMFFNKGQKINKFGLINAANMNVIDPNMSEIVKKAVYAPDNYMLRKMEESVI